MRATEKKEITMAIAGSQPNPEDNDDCPTGLDRLDGLRDSSY